MPFRYDVTLSTARRDADGITRANVHRLACHLLDDRHRHKESQKPFALWPLLTGEQGEDLAESRLVLRINWLGDDDVIDTVLRQATRTPQLRGPVAVEFVDVERIDPASFCQAEPATQVVVRFLSPTWFQRRDGTAVDYPDPAFAVGSLARRWNGHACSRTLQLDRDRVTELVRDTHVEWAAVHKAPVWDTGRRMGFVGDACFALGSECPELRSAFSGLFRWAACAGVGKGTPQGNGAVQLLAVA